MLSWTGHSVIQGEFLTIIIILDIECLLRSKIEKGEKKKEHAPPSKNKKV